MRIAILTISDAGAKGERRDTSGDDIQQWATDRGYTVVARSLVPDDSVPIITTLRNWADTDAADLALTTGGTGLGPRDATPEATRRVLDREAPGIAERIRVKSVDTFPHAALSRGIAGSRKKLLIINLPGSPAGVKDGLLALDAIIDHAVAVLRADRFEH